MSTTMKQYQQLEARIRKSDLDAQETRWEFGRKLLGERGDKKRLPDGRLEELANALASSRSELKNRMQFAEEYSTKAEVRAAFEKYGSWSEICARGMGARYANEELAERNDAREEAEVARLRAEAALDAKNQTGEPWRRLRIALVEAHNALVDLEPQADVSEVFTLLQHVDETVDRVFDRVFGETGLRAFVPQEPGVAVR